jgi:cation-transporting P-type ATPase I
MLRGVTARLVGLGGAAVGAAAAVPLGAAEVAGSLLSQAVGGVARTAMPPVAALVRNATTRIEAPSPRRTWLADGRAQIEVLGLTGDAASLLATSVEDLLKTLPGVVWARVDVVTRRAVVRFDAAELTAADLIDAVERAEKACDVDAAHARPEAPGFAGDSAPVTVEAWALAADLVGLSAAVAGRLVRFPALPGGVAAAAVLVDNQPRLRRLLESRLGTPVTDLVLAVSNATALGLTQGSASLAVDAGQRAQAVVAARARRAAAQAREDELWDADRPARHEPVDVGERPVALPQGPVERYADRAATGSLLAAGGLFALTGSLDIAGRAILIGAPKAARAGREAFADILTTDLSRRGLLLLDPDALRRLDRVDTVVIHSAVLHGDRELIVSARSLADSWTVEHVWSAGQRLLGREDELPVPPPRGRHRYRLALLEVSDAASPDLPGLSPRVLTEDGVPVGEVLVGTELDGLADAVLSAAQAAGLRLVLTADAAAPELIGRADEVLDSRSALWAEVRRLQAEGRVVAVVASDEDALATADLGVGIIPPRGRVPWAADLLIGPGLTDVPRLLSAVPRARAVSSRGVTSAAAATFLGGLIAAVGRPGRPSRAVLPVTGAAAVALLSGTMTARQICRQPPPTPVLHTPWHSLEADEVLGRLPVPSPGVISDVPGSAWQGLLAPVSALAKTVSAELADPLTPVLGTGAAASAVIGSPTDALLVGGVLAANAVISATQRLRAERALGQLLAGQALPARVVRTPGAPSVGGAAASDAGRRMRQAIEGGASTVPATALRIGDVIALEPGEVVPADARLLWADALEVDEATLTGESAAVDKDAQATPGAELADRTGMVYEGTTVLAGTGRAVVVATGAATEAGRALALAGRAGAPAGMQARLEELTRRGLPLTMLGGAAVSGLALLRGQSLRGAVASGVSVAVAAVPEGLPLVATVAQLGAARRLSARGVLVRSARTVEALGRVDTVCFDKTGTLTEGRLRLARVAGPDRPWAPDTPEARRVLRAAARACPPPQPDRPLAHATDQAIIDAARDILDTGDREDWEELSELPFHSDRGFSAALGRTGGSVRLVVKGAPEVLLPRCTHQRDDAGKRPLDRRGRERAIRTVHGLAAEGLRVLAVARRNVSDVLPAATGAAATADPEDLTEDLTLLGFVALADIPRPEAASTVSAVQKAGLSTVMITGDHPITAKAIAAGLGIPSQRVVTGPELAGLDEAGRARLVTEASVFARVSPEQKLRIIAALQRAGRVVAMTGDGANDAAAIRLADVGIGMAAHGSTSARAAADLVLTDPDLSLLLDALVEGRAMWGRVRDAVAILLGGNAGEVGFTLVGTALAGSAPIGTRQFLLVNMLTDLLPSMAIALAPSPQAPADRRAVLSAGAPSLGRPLLRDIAVRGVATGAGSLVAWQIGRVTGTRRRASTMALAALVGTQLGQTLLVGARNPLVLATGLGSTALLAAIIQTPGVSQFFGCTPLDPLAWLTVAGCAGGTTLLAAAAGRLLPAPEPAGG